MAQPSQIVPTVTLNVSGNRQQVNLRDYLNVRVAPFLKKAIHDSLETEAQYPLQWLGEHLIQQSIIYEGNPDATNLRERFVYNHDIAIPKPEASNETVASNQEPHGQSPVNQDHNTVNGIGAAPAHPGQEAESHNLSSNPLHSDAANAAPAPDTEMGGTS